MSPIRIHSVDYIFCFFPAFACVGMKLGWLWRRFFVGFTDTMTPPLHGKKIALAHSEGVIQSSSFFAEIMSLAYLEKLFKPESKVELVPLSDGSSR